MRRLFYICARTCVRRARTVRWWRGARGRRPNQSDKSLFSEGPKRRNASESENADHSQNQNSASNNHQQQEATEELPHLSHNSTSKVYKEQTTR